MTAKNRVIVILFTAFLIMFYISAKTKTHSTQNPTISSKIPHKT
jgi:hypothetical protein